MGPILLLQGNIWQTIPLADALKLKADLRSEYLPSLDIRDNPLQCDNKMCWLLNPSITITIWVSPHPCDSPPQMKTAHWENLTTDRLQCGKLWGKRGPLNWSCKSNMAAWPVPGHEASLSNKCLTKFGLKGWHFLGMTSIFSLYHVPGTLKLTKIG